MDINKHRRVMLALLRHQGGVLTINKDDRAMRDVRLVLGHLAEQGQEVEVTHEDERTVTYRLVAALQEEALPTSQPTGTASRGRVCSEPSQDDPALL